MAHKTFGKIIVAALALLQGALGALRAFQLFEAGSDLMGRGLVLLPLVGVVAWVRGLIVVVIALLYAVFALGLWFWRDWASTLGLTVAVVNILLVLSALVQGAAIIEAFFWLIVPVLIFGYLLSPSGQRLSENS